MRGEARCTREIRRNENMRTISRIIATAALAATTATAFEVPADARHRHHYYGRTYYRHKVCRRSSATTGTVVGGVAGAVAGPSIIGHGILGAVAGGGGGAGACGGRQRRPAAPPRLHFPPRSPG